MCLLDVAFTTATVRGVRPYGRAYGKFCKSGHLWRFQTLRCFVSHGRCAFCDIQTCFVPCRKSLCVAGTILLRRFQKMRCSFRGRRSTLDVSIVILRGKRSFLDASNRARHQSQPSAIRATPATQSDDPIHVAKCPVPYVPRLPRKVTIHVAKRHACVSNCTTPAT